MVFSSVSSFLDPPINWPQSANSNNLPSHAHHHLELQESGSIASGHQILSHHFPPNPNPNHHHVYTTSASTVVNPTGSNGSAAERARLAKNTQPPEAALKCPRCDSSNTKFCYFNNYNLTQPRHFCKACRRYWTRGGALRNVPVGGGCRRNNKKGKTGNSKSSSQNKQSTSMVNAPSTSTINNVHLQTNNQLPFQPTLQNLTQLGGIGLNLAAINGNNGGNGNTSSSFLNDLGFFHGANSSSGPVMTNNNNNENNIMTSLGSASHFALFDRPMGLYSFPNEGNMGNFMGLSTSSATIEASRVSQTAPVKIEEAHLGNTNRQVSGLASQGNQYWTSLGHPGSSSSDQHKHQM